ncbi:MAG: hypothetical protein Q7T77_02420 [Sulfuricurvum sp.]|nr:hypothetical protein [Sulfuricurvum sp.]
MKRIIGIALIAGCMYGPLNASNFDIGISGSERGINGFSLSIGNYYHVPAQEIIMIERSIPYEETSVVYFLAQHSHRTPNYIANLRLRGMSWWDISIHLGLNPRTLYVIDSRRHSGPLYGKAYGYQRLNDSDIVELVNVRFLSSYHGISVDDVIDRRSRGQQYMHIDDEYRMKKYNHQIQQRVIDRRNQQPKMQHKVENRVNKQPQIQQQSKNREEQNRNQKTRDNKQDHGNKNRDDKR